MVHPGRASAGCLVLVSTVAALVASEARAAGRRPARASKTKSAAHAGKKAPAPPKVIPDQQGKVVVFPIKDDDDHSYSAQVERLLRARGLEIVTGVRRVDTAEQYRE